MKRRILVAFEEDCGADPPQKRQRKLAVSIDKAATNAELAKKIAQTLQKPIVTLEISGGFELREQDGVDMIGEDDIVTVRLVSPVDARDTDPEPDPLLVAVTGVASSSDVLPDAVARFKIRFFTAEHALAHARETPKERTEPVNGMFAFNSKPVNGNITLRTLEQEAARVLQWTSPEAMDVACDHVDDAACSCPIAREIEENGLSSTFHCRSTVDGSSCGNAECPYSHVELTDSNMAGAPHCTICLDALAFPCPGCLARAEYAGKEPASVIFCPLVQNGHLHHAHCVGPRMTIRAANCPSGCSIQRFPREAADLETRAPHLIIIIVWDGDKLYKIPIPSSMFGGASRVSTIALTTDTIISIVEAFLASHHFARPGLSVRIHFRDPVTETLRFSQSTLVSVCPSSSHVNPAYRRFPLFSSLIPSPNTRRFSAFSIDFHTSCGPIVACGCTPVNRLFPPPGPAGESSIVLYVVKRQTGNAIPDKRVTASKQSMYLEDPAWHPSVPQTPRGIAVLLSSLYLLAHSVAQKGVAAEQKVLALAYAIFRFPPAIRTLAQLLLNKVPAPEDKTALSEILYHALNDFSARGPYAITNRQTRRFETARILLAHIADASDAQSAAVPRRPVEDVSLLCALSQKRLRDPVSLNSVLVERTVAYLHQPGGALYRPSHSTAPSAIVELSPEDIMLQILPRLRGLLSTSALLLRVRDIGSAPTSAMSAVHAAARDFTAAIRRANQTDLVSQGPLDLKSVQVIAPRIVVDQQGLLAVFTGRGCGTSRDVNFFRPTNGGDTAVDVNDVSHALQKVIKVRKTEDTWQVDTFGEVSSVVRPPDEAIVLCLDLSQSMTKRSGVKRSSLPAFQEPVLDLDAETEKIVAELVANRAHANIVETAEAHLRVQHDSCHHAWRILSNASDQRGVDLLSRLSVIASRDLLRLSVSHEDGDEGARDPAIRTTILQLACFVFVTSDAVMNEELRASLIRLIDSPNVDMIGPEPFNGSFDTTASLVLGLITFSSQVSVEQELTPIFENFRQRLDRVEADGDTAIYDALDSARQMLSLYRADLPNLRKRIVIVSDGEDTSSKTPAQEVCLALQRARVTVDSVQVGPRSDPVLRAISVATGGCRFSPRTSLADVLSIFDLETMLYSGERPLRSAKPFVTSEAQLFSYQNLYWHPIDVITVDNFPPRAEHPLLQQPVKSAANSAGMSGGGDDRMKRIMRKIKAVVTDPHPNIDVYFNNGDMSFLKIILEAPKDVDNCPYKGGTFLLTCDLPVGYPRDPPEVRFVTFIIHPNVRFFIYLCSAIYVLRNLRSRSKGKFVLLNLDALWSSDINLKEIFSLVYGTLLTPDLENPLEIQASLKYYEDDGTYALAVADAVTKHASKTRAQWRGELDAC
ncbi:hypothetical protein DFH09DRAFT_1503902 [Mycena vulgaris]|nr:hypothetical protein DFH09DRAFT_1503902 [Mycena vulgaris]